MLLTGDLDHGLPALDGALARAGVAAAGEGVQRVQHLHQSEVRTGGTLHQSQLTWDFLTDTLISVKELPVASSSPSVSLTDFIFSSSHTKNTSLACATLDKILM